MRHLASVALWALTAFGIILVAASALGSGDAAWAQQPEQSVPPIASADPLSPKCEAASVRLAAPGDQTLGTLPAISVGRLEFQNVTLRVMMYYAYGTQRTLSAP